MHAEAMTFNCHFAFKYLIYLSGNLKASQKIGVTSDFHQI